MLIFQQLKVVFIILDEIFAVFENETTKATISPFCEFLAISSDLFLFKTLWLHGI